MFRFECDYTEGCIPEILDAIARENHTQLCGYSEDPICDRARKKIMQLCGDADVDVHFLVGGTQTNTTVIASALRPFQGVISAEIQAQRQILEAEAKAAVTVAEAQASYDTAVSVAASTQYTQVAQARADVSEFMASVAADQAHTDAYRYYKYLNAIGQAYGQARLVIVGEGVNSSNLYFGSMVLN